MQISVMHPRFYTRVAVLAVLIALTTTQKCEHEVTDRHVINVPKSEKNGVVFMANVYKPTREECQNECCTREKEELDDGSFAKCNLAVFHHSGRPQNANCFLIFCPTEGSCIFSPVKGFSSSFVTQVIFDTTDYEVSHKPPSLKFSNPDDRPLKLHRLFKRSHGGVHTPGPKAADESVKTAEEAAGKEMMQVEGKLMQMVESEIKQVAEKQDGPEQTTTIITQTSVSTTTVKPAVGKNNPTPQGPVVTPASILTVGHGSSPKTTTSPAVVDVKTTTEVNLPQRTTSGPSAAVQLTSKQAISSTLPPPPQPTTSVPANPVTSSSLPNSTPPGQKTPEPTLSLQLKPAPSLSITTQLPSPSPAGSTVSRPSTVHPTESTSVTSLPSSPAVKTNAPTPAPSITSSASDALSTVTHPSTLVESMSTKGATPSQSLPSSSSSSLSSNNSSTDNSPSSQTPLPHSPSTTSYPVPPTASSPASNPFVPILTSSTTLPSAPSTAPFTIPLYPTSLQPNNAPDANLTTVELIETTQASTFFSDEDVPTPTNALVETPSQTSASPSETTPSLPSSNSESNETLPATIEGPERKQLEATNQTFAGNETAAATDEVEGDEETASTSLISSNGALIAAVCFGVLFLMAVMVVIGKHWYDAYQRRHYSKVDYLINGMYN